MLGSRYATDVRIRRQLEASTVGAQGALMRGREAAERLAWADAYAALSLAGRSTPLAAEDLELLATAAYLLGHVEDCLGALRRAHQLYAEGGDHRRAAWCAGWLGFHMSSRGDLAQASGWFGRASRLLEREPHECAEHGYLPTSVAFQQLVAGDFADARATAERAAEAARGQPQHGPGCGGAAGPSPPRTSRLDAGLHSSRRLVPASARAPTAVYSLAHSSPRTVTLPRRTAATVTSDRPGS